MCIRLGDSGRHSRVRVDLKPLDIGTGIFHFIRCIIHFDALIVWEIVRNISSRHLIPKGKEVWDVGRAEIFEGS